MASSLLRQVFLVPSRVSGEKWYCVPWLDHIFQQCSASGITSRPQFGDLPWVPGPQLPEASASWALISVQWAQHAPRTPTYLLLTQQAFLVAPSEPPSLRTVVTRGCLSRIGQEPPQLYCPNVMAIPGGEGQPRTKNAHRAGSRICLKIFFYYLFIFNNLQELCFFFPTN